MAIINGAFGIDEWAMAHLSTSERPGVRAMSEGRGVPPPLDRQCTHTPTFPHLFLLCFKPGVKEC